MGARVFCEGHGHICFASAVSLAGSAHKNIIKHCYWNDEGKDYLYFCNWQWHVCGIELESVTGTNFINGLVLEPFFFFLSLCLLSVTKENSILSYFFLHKRGVWFLLKQLLDFLWRERERRRPRKGGWGWVGRRDRREERSSVRKNKIDSSF
jgi:hypothetical protein